MKRILLPLILLALLTSSAFAQDQLHGFFLGATASLNTDGSAMTLKDNLAPQASAVVQVGGEASNTYYLPGLTWKANTGWLQVDALSFYTKLTTLNWCAVFMGASASPVTFSTGDGVKRENVGVGGLDFAAVIPLNKKQDKLFLALGLKYNIAVDYGNSTETDRTTNEILLTAGVVGLNPFKK